MLNFVNRSNLEEIVSKLAAVDGISIRAITRSEFIRESIAYRGHNLPKNETDVMNLIHAHFEALKKKMIGELSEKINNKKRFSLTLDEWTSSRMKKYVNVILHGIPNEEYNLGLVRILGSCTATKLLEVVKEHLASFQLNYEQHIVGTTGDGASLMVKFGKECPTLYQLCLNHGVHLGVCDTIYKKKHITQIEEESTEAEDDSDSDSEFDFEITSTKECIEEVQSINQIIDKVRKVVKFFKLSPIKNGILQEKIRGELGNDLQLSLDCRTRWSSLAYMITTFVKLEKPIVKALLDLNCSNMLNDIDFTQLKDLQNSLEPAKLAIDVLSRSDTNLNSARIVLDYMISKMSKCTTEIAKDLFQNMQKRMDERIDKNLMNLCEALKNPNVVITKPALKLATELLKRLYKTECNNELLESQDQEIIIVENENALTMQEELNLLLKNADEPPRESDSYKKLKDEFLLFKNTGKRTHNLNDLCNALSTIKPTSTSNERTFSVSSGFCTKIRSRLADKSLNALVFLKYFYINKKN